jgi:hypothetical protein
MQAHAPTADVCSKKGYSEPFHMARPGRKLILLYYNRLKLAGRKCNSVQCALAVRACDVHMLLLSATNPMAV